jgi:hypothetical protein
MQVSFGELIYTNWGCLAGVGTEKLGKLHDLSDGLHLGTT